MYSSVPRPSWKVDSEEFAFLRRQQKSQRQACRSPDVPVFLPGPDGHGCKGKDSCLPPRKANRLDLTAGVARRAPDLPALMPSRETRRAERRQVWR